MGQVRAHEIYLINLKARRAAIRRTLKSADVELIDENGTGVRLRKLVKKIRRDRLAATKRTQSLPAPRRGRQSLGLTALRASGNLSNRD
jgi:hypothetical protein